MGVITRLIFHNHMAIHQFRPANDDKSNTHTHTHPYAHWRKHTPREIQALSVTDVRLRGHEHGQHKGSNHGAVRMLNRPTCVLENTHTTKRDILTHNAHAQMCAAANEVAVDRFLL